MSLATLIGLKWIDPNVLMLHHSISVGSGVLFHILITATYYIHIYFHLDTLCSMQTPSVNFTFLFCHLKCMNRLIRMLMGINLKRCNNWLSFAKSIRVVARGALYLS